MQGFRRRNNVMQTTPRILLSIIFSLTVLLIPGCVNKEMSFDQHLAKAREFSREGKVDKAIDEYEKAIKSNPSAGDVYAELGDAYFYKATLNRHGEDRSAKENASIAYRKALK